MQQDNSEPNHFVFVYGTLKRGFPNYDAALLERFFVAECYSEHCYPLVVANQYFSPVLIDERNNGEHVQGELYRADDATLEALDTLEGLDQSWGYHRGTIALSADQHGEIEAFAYFKHRSDLTAIHSSALALYPNEARYVHPSHRL